jgi:hypothetical protein
MGVKNEKKKTKICPPCLHRYCKQGQPHQTLTR